MKVFWNDDPHFQRFLFSVLKKNLCQRYGSNTYEDLQFCPLLFLSGFNFFYELLNTLQVYLHQCSESIDLCFSNSNYILAQESCCCNEELMT